MSTVPPGPFRLRTPPDLEVTEAVPRRILLVGSCTLESFPANFAALHPECQADLYVRNHVAALPAELPFGRPTDYDLQLLQIPTCSLLPEAVHFRLAYDDVDGYEELFRATRARLFAFLEAGLEYHREFGLLTFVTNLLVPQDTLIGRLQPRADLRNLPYFVTRLNEELQRAIDELDNVFVLDLDGIAASLGRRFVQDDLVWSTSHGAVLTDWDHDRDADRLAQPAPLSDSIPFRTAEFVREACEELFAMWRTLRQVDPVKLVIVDLDDTLWRGVVAEEEDIGIDTWAGWPMGMVEALLVLRRRGVVLAVASKNDHATIERLLPQIFCDLLRLDDFVSVKLDWKPKAENIEAVLREVNVLPSSAVVIDDNPVERAAVRAAFPEIRVLGDNLYDVRRILLWSAETQVPVITSESGRRSEMVRSQIQREEQRARMGREEFLQSLGLRVQLHEVRGSSDARFARALQLLNRTNQFNSTGVRWTPEQAQHLFEEGGLWVTVEVADSYSDYGLTALVVVDREGIRQMVLSCRVVGLGVEEAVLAELERRARRGGFERLRLDYQDTGKNALVAPTLAHLGYRQQDGWWLGELDQDRSVPHVEISADGLALSPWTR